MVLKGGAYCKCSAIYARDTISFDDETAKFFCAPCGREIDIVEIILELCDGLKRLTDDVIELRGASNITMHERLERIQERQGKISRRIDETIMKLSDKLNKDE